MGRTLDGIFAVVLVIWTAAWVAFWRASFWLVRFAYRRRHRIPHGHIVVPAAGAYAPLWLVAGPGPALLVVAAGAVWIVGTPRLERRYSDSGESAPRPLTFAASTARIATRKLAAVHVRFAWRQACKTAGLQPARIRKVEEVPAGWRIAVTFAAGEHAGYAEKRAASLASSLRAREVRCYTRGDDLRDGTIIVSTGADPLATETGPWPWRDRAQTCLWDPVPIGRDQNGSLVTISLVEQNALVGGIPGAGKSVLASMIVAHAALDPHAILFLVDGKGGLEFHPWAASAEQVGADVPEAIAILEQLQTVLDARVADLKARGRRKVQPDDGLPLYLLAIDELAEFTKAQSKKDADKFNGLLRSLVSRGRAAGIIVVACTQKPEATTVPTSIRDLISIRVALNCRTGAASDTILGAGMAAAGYDASTIPQGQPGTAYLLSETARPFRFRSFLVGDHDVAQLAQRAAQLRERAGTIHTPQAQANQNGALVLPPGQHDVPDGHAATGPQKFADGEAAPSGPSEPAKLLHSEPVPPDDASEPRRHLQVVPEESNPRAVLQFRLALELRDHEADSDRAIAKRLGCSGPTVAAARKRLGLPPSRAKRSA